MAKNILMVSDGMFHPPLMGQVWLRRTLTGMPGFNFRRINSMANLPRVDLRGFDGMVLYFHHKNILQQALDAFDAFVIDGGGVLAIHSVTASFKNSDQFTFILGGKFSGHGPIESFAVTPVDINHGIFKGIPAFKVTDELYLHKLQPDIETQFTTRYKGQAVPVVWTRNYGKGRVCFACPGHRAASMQVPAYQQILTRGLQWVVKA